LGHNPGQFQPGHTGKPKGAKNKLSRAFKDGLLHVFHELGGKTAMLEWARSNPTFFYQILAKLTPTELSIDLRTEMRPLVIDRVSDRAELEAARADQDVELFDDDVVDITPPEPERPSLVPAPVPEPDPDDVVPHFS